MSAAPEATRALQWLVNAARFVAVPNADEDRLELVRWWTGGWADRLILRAEADAELQRFAGIDPRQPVPGRLVRRDRLTVVEIADVVRAWGSPSLSSRPMRLSSMDGAVEVLRGSTDFTVLSSVGA